MTTRVQLQRTLDGGHRLIVAEDSTSIDGTTIRVADGFTWQEHPEGSMWSTTEGIKDSNGLVQSIIDAAWEAGFRPTGFTDVKNETAAIRDHLGDMRRIVFRQLKIDD